MSIVAVVGAIITLALAGIRIDNAFSFTEPLQLDTSGAEWESLYAVWRVINDLDLYTDRRMIPFNAVVYNWFFYHSFAAFTGTVMAAMNLADAWLPTVARMFSLVGAAIGFVFAYISFIRALPIRDTVYKLIALSFAAYIMAGPLIGWWVFTVRSDLWAMVFDIVGAALFLKYYSSRRVTAVLIICLAAYLAWSCKQVNVFTIGGVGLFLLARRDWPMVVLISLLLPAAWAATLFIGGHDYVQNILFSITAGFTWETYFRVLINFSVKSGPTLFALAAVVVIIGASRDLRRKFWNDDYCLFALCTILVTASIVSLASAKYGAAENYYFSLSYFLALAVFAGIGLIMRDRSALPSLITGATSAGWVSLMAAILLVFGGAQGTLNLRPHHDLMMAMKKCIDPLPRPIFISHGRVALPWMAPGQSPNFVTSFSYNKEREAGVSFEAGGIAGLIDSGYFQSLAIYGLAVPTTFDGASLAGFNHVSACEKLQLFVRNANS